MVKRQIGIAKRLAMICHFMKQETTAFKGLYVGAGEWWIEK